MTFVLSLHNPRIQIQKENMTEIKYFDRHEYDNNDQNIHENDLESEPIVKSSGFYVTGFDIKQINITKKHLKI
jgi:hypothetical protein